MLVSLLKVTLKIQIILCLSGLIPNWYRLSLKVRRGRGTWDVGRGDVGRGDAGTRGRGDAMTSELGDARGFEDVINK